MNPEILTKAYMDERNREHGPVLPMRGGWTRRCYDPARTSSVFIWLSVAVPIFGAIAGIIVLGIIIWWRAAR